MQRISKRTKRMIAFIMVYMIIVVNVIVAYASVPEGESVTSYEEIVDQDGEVRIEEVEEPEDSESYGEESDDADESGQEESEDISDEVTQVEEEEIAESEEMPDDNLSMGLDQVPEEVIDPEIDQTNVPSEEEQEGKAEPVEGEDVSAIPASTPVDTTTQAQEPGAQPEAPTEPVTAVEEEKEIPESSKKEETENWEDAKVQEEEDSVDAAPDQSGDQEDATEAERVTEDPAVPEAAAETPEKEHEVETAQGLMITSAGMEEMEGAEVITQMQDDPAANQKMMFEAAKAKIAQKEAVNQISNNIVAAN